MRSPDRIVYDLIVTFIGFVFVFLRIWVRYYVNRRSVWSARKAYVLSDVCLVVSFVFAAAVAGLDVRMQSWKLKNIEGLDMKAPEVWGITMKGLGVGWIWLRWNFKIGYYLLLLAWISLYFAKGSFLLFYWVTTPSLSRKVYWFLVGITGCTIATFIVTIYLLVFSCFPVSRNWVLSQENCLATTAVSAWSTNVTTVILSTLHLSTHLALLILGFLIVRAHIGSLHQRQWLGVTMLFGLGILVFTAHCIRFAVHMSISTDYKGVGGNVDFEPVKVFERYAGGRLETWMLVSSLAELHICLIAVSLPTLERWGYRRKVAAAVAAAAAAEAGFDGNAWDGEEKGRRGRSRLWKDRAKVWSESAARMRDGLPRPPPQAMSFHLTALSTFRSGHGGMTRLSTGDTVTVLVASEDDDVRLGSGHVKQGSGSFAESSRDRRSKENKEIRVYGAMESVDLEFERRGSVKIVNAAGNF